MKRKEKPYAQKLIPKIILAVVLYAIADICLQIFKDVEISTTLTTCWFAFWGIEIVNLAVIKVGKIRTPEDFGTLEAEELEEKGEDEL